MIGNNGTMICNNGTMGILGMIGTQRMPSQIPNRWQGKQNIQHGRRNIQHGRRSFLLKGRAG
jgi:hypothetical protein